MKILLTEQIHEDGVKVLESVGEVILATGTDEDTIIKEGKDADAILVRVAKITRKIIDNLPKLKVVAKHGVGVDNIDIEACNEHEIYIVNAPESNTNSVAEHTATLILAAAKNILFLDKLTREGDFKKRNAYPTVELKDKTIGFIGMGNIASLAAEKLSSFGVKVIAYDPYKETIENGILVNSLDEIFKNADVISLHVPLNDKTLNLIGERELSLMKKNTIICSTARGGIINEDALYNALKNNQIYGAALDVFTVEPPIKENKLFELNNIIVSPHNAALSSQALINMAVHSATGIKEILLENNTQWIVNRGKF